MGVPSQQKNGYVVSDLHMFGCSSLYRRHLPEFYNSVSRHSTVVLNGDTFDFKRSNFRSAADTTAHALNWLTDLVERSPHTIFHYLVGNHDCQNSLISGIAKLTQTHGNIQLHHFHVRLGTNLFLHGDVLDLPDSSTDIAALRQRYSAIEPSMSSKLFAEVVTRLRLNMVEYIRHNTQSVADRITRHLQSACPGELDGVRAIYFGHTHVPIKGFEWRGLTFYNTGSLIRGLRWMPLEFEF